MIEIGEPTQGWCTYCLNDNTDEMRLVVRIDSSDGVLYENADICESCANKIHTAFGKLDKRTLRHKPILQRCDGTCKGALCSHVLCVICRSSKQDGEGFCLP